MEYNGSIIIKMNSIVCLLFDDDYDDERYVDDENDNDGGSKDSNLMCVCVDTTLERCSKAK